MNSPIKFKELEGLEIYVCGTMADEFVNMLAARSGLELTRDPSGMLIYATTTILVESTENPGEMVEKTVIKTIDGPGVSKELQKIVIETIDGVKADGTKLLQVDIDAQSSEDISKFSKAQRDDVFIDAFRNFDSEEKGIADVVDMTDMEAIGEAPIFQSAMLAHILTERSTSTNFTAAHNVGLRSEKAVIKEEFPDAWGRQSRNEKQYFGHKLLTIPGQQGGTYLFDYLEVKFLLHTSYRVDKQGNVEAGSFNPDSVEGIKIVE
jgi:hypothetical protein